MRRRTVAAIAAVTLAAVAVPLVGQGSRGPVEYSPAKRAAALQKGFVPAEIAAAESDGIDLLDPNTPITRPEYPNGTDPVSGTFQVGAGPQVAGPAMTMQKRSALSAARSRRSGAVQHHVVTCDQLMFAPSQSGRRITVQGTVICPVSVIPGIRVCIQVTGSGVWQTINCRPAENPYYEPGDAIVTLSHWKDNCGLNLQYRGSVRGAAIHLEGAFLAPSPYFGPPKTCV